ncbi:hypothetical protein QR680_008387 [Steinernema hermaphroditum]|uniref:Uncharacterized protein n=1 Tax=Steinernema hermaphroditum TaxID=289476 RepID=A0AA39M7J7_9BILA|nr:hypothetical protein QR680_008387 [Steinernema hermaphroditum]
MPLSSLSNSRDSFGAAKMRLWILLSLFLVLVSAKYALKLSEYDFYDLSSEGPTEPDPSYVDYLDPSIEEELRTDEYLH